MSLYVMLSIVTDKRSPFTSITHRKQNLNSFFKFDIVQCTNNKAHKGHGDGNLDPMALQLLSTSLEW